MNELAALSAIMPVQVAPADIASVNSTMPASYGMNSTAGPNFVDFLGQSFSAADTKLAEADQLVQQFAVDDSIPLHQVTIALEEARLSVELMMQVRARVLESYRDFMNMQV